MDYTQASYHPKQTVNADSLYELQRTLEYASGNQSPNKEDLEKIEEEPLLSDKELEAEANLGDAVSVWLREISKIKMLTPEEERTVALAALQGDKNAAHRLAEANLRLVVSIAKRFKTSTMEQIDLIAEGNVGLLKAIPKFDPLLGYRFSTYATWWIRQSISRAIADQSRAIRLPVHVSEAHLRIVKATRILEQQNGRDPTIEELAEQTGMLPEKIVETLKHVSTILSLDTPVNENEDSSICDIIPANENDNPANESMQAIMQQAIQDILATACNEREQRVLALRFGLNGHSPHTLEQVGEEFNLTRERIRQIENKALRKLRKPQNSRLLRDFLT